jgi:hypothetical protein
VEVLPGPYQIRVRIGGSESTSQIEVLADPRVEIPLADRIQRRNAVQEGLALTGTLQDIQERLRTTTEGLSQLEARLQARRDDEAENLRALVDSVRNQMGPLEESLTQVTREGFSLYSMGLTRDAPTEADRINLVKMGESVDRIVTRFNAFLGGPVENLRQGLEASGIGAFPDVRTVQRRAGSSGGSDR